MAYFTKKNVKNWKWWIGAAVFLIMVAILSPLILIGAIIDLIDAWFDFIYRKLDRLTSKAWKNLGNWINK